MTNPNTERTPIIDKNGKPTHVHKKVAAAPKPSGRLPAIQGIPSTPAFVFRNSEERRSELLDVVAFYSDAIEQIEEDVALLNSKINHPASSDESVDEFRNQIAGLLGTKSAHRSRIETARTEMFYIDSFDFYTEPKPGKVSFCASFDEHGAVIALMDGKVSSLSAIVRNEDVRKLTDFFRNVESGAHVAPQWESPSVVMESLNDLEGELSAIRQKLDEVADVPDYDPDAYVPIAQKLKEVRAATFRERAKLIAGEVGFDHMVDLEGTASWNKHSALGFTLDGDGSMHALLITDGRKVLGVDMSKADVVRLTSHLNTL